MVWGSDIKLSVIVSQWLPGCLPGHFQIGEMGYGAGTNPESNGASGPGATLEVVDDQSGLLGAVDE